MRFQIRALEGCRNCVEIEEGCFEAVFNPQWRFRYGSVCISLALGLAIGSMSDPGKKIPQSVRIVSSHD